MKMCAGFIWAKVSVYNSVMNRFLALLLFSSFIPATANATRTVTSPWVDEGTLKLKSKTGITHDNESRSRDGAVAQVFGAEYGFTDRFSLEGEGLIENKGDDDNTDVNALAIKAKGLFTEKGKYWLDAGARLTYEANLADDPDNIELKLILAKDTEKFRHIANIILDRDVGADSNDETNGGLSWSSRYKWMPEFEPGFELYSNTGALGDRADFEDQDHSIGPVAYGKIGSIKYEAGYLAGLTENAADGRFKVILEYGLKF